VPGHAHFTTSKLSPPPPLPLPFTCAHSPASHPARRQPWAEDDMDLTALQMWVGRNLAHASAALAAGVTGHASLQWRTRTVSAALTAVADFAWSPSLNVSAFLSGWTRAAFGESIAVPAAAILLQVDSGGMPRPISCDPGCLQVRGAVMKM
jgi:hypothetical protein